MVGVRLLPLPQHLIHLSSQFAAPKPNLPILGSYCFLGSAIVPSVGTSFADEQAPCRVIGDKVNPRFTALWVADDGVWAADDLNHALILYDRLSGKEKKRVLGLRTGLDFPAAVQVDPSIKLPDGKQGLIWASMNDTADRVTAYAKQDVDAADSPVDLAPAAVIRFNTIRIEGRTIYRGARVYGFHADEQNDEIALGFEKRDFIDPDGHSSLGSVVIVNRGGADFSQLGAGKRWIRGAHTGIANPHGVWIDASHNEIYVANYGHLPQRAPQMPSITVYDRLANGDTPPKRTIQGSRTHLGMPINVFVDDKNDELIVADDQEGILVFDRLANGDATPKRMIASHNMPNGVFVDTARDELVVANWEHRSIEFYARNWIGPRPLPVRAISSSHFGLACFTKRFFNGRSGRSPVSESIEAQSPFGNHGLGYRRLCHRSTARLSAKSGSAIMRTAGARSRLRRTCRSSVSAIPGRWRLPATRSSRRTA
jgi:hypothetical protein